MQSKLDFKATILISFYNASDTIVDCLNSCLVSCLIENIFFLLVDDASTDHSRELVRQWFSRHAHLSYVLLSNNQNRGLGYSLQKGLLSSPTDLVLRLDADDLVFPTRFVKQINYMLDNPNVSICGSSVMRVDQVSGFSVLCSNPNDDLTIKRNIFLNPIFHPSVIFRKSKILALGGYKPYRRKQDYELWLRCVSHGLVFANIMQPLVVYKVSLEPSKISFSSSIQHFKIAFPYWVSLGYGPRSFVFIILPLLRSLLPPKLVQIIYSYNSYLRKALFSS